MKTPKPIIALVSGLLAMTSLCTVADIIPLLPGDRDTDLSGTIFDFSGLAEGESFYVITTVTSSSSAGFNGLVAVSGIGEEFYLGRIFNSNFGVAQNPGGGNVDVSSIPTGAAQTVLLLKATAGNSAATDSMEYWVNPNLSLLETETPPRDPVS